MKSISIAIILAGGALTLHRLALRLQLSRAKHPSLAGHAKLSRRMARLIRLYEYPEPECFGIDGAPADIVSIRRTAVLRLSEKFSQRFTRSASATAELESAIPDLAFTSRYRVPFQFRSLARRYLRSGGMLTSSSGVMVRDLDGNEFYDLTGSYGVNVLGHDFYKRCIAHADTVVGELGPVLGPYHPVIADNVRRLQRISGMDAVSFHMSGTEAVMQAVRLARYHTGRPKLVRFCGAYHGWWGDVQPGVGTPQDAPDTWTLRDMSDAALHVLDTRRDIACVLVNPLQALHPNASAPADSALVDSSRCAGVDREAYAQWLGRLREVCTRRGIVLLFDEVFVGFRLAMGGAQEYFGVRADLVTYGKTLGGGLPVGVVCGNAALMKRYRDDRPVDICFARGTFNSHPYVMAAMNEFLRFLDTDAANNLYRGVDALWNARAASLNARLQAAGLPVRVANLSSIWTVLYSQPSRYNWMFQYYLRDTGLALSWVGSGRLIFSLNYTAEDFAAVADRFVAAAAAMQNDGWWWNGHLTNKGIRRRILREVAQEWWRACIGSISSPRNR